jgi:hypothetical protein
MAPLLYSAGHDVVVYKRRFFEKWSNCMTNHNDIKIGSALISAAAVCVIYAATGKKRRSAADDERARIREPEKMERRAVRKREKRKKFADLFLRVAAAVMERLPM